MLVYWVQLCTVVHVGKLPTWITVTRLWSLVMLKIAQFLCARLTVKKFCEEDPLRALARAAIEELKVGEGEFDARHFRAGLNSGRSLVFAKFFLDLTKVEEGDLDGKRLPEYFDRVLYASNCETFFVTLLALNLLESRANARWSSFCNETLIEQIWVELNTDDLRDIREQYAQETLLLVVKLALIRAGRITKKIAA